MAVALKSRYFDSAGALTAFCVDPANNVAVVRSILYDTTTAQFVLFWTE